MIMEILNICMTKECRVWTVKDNYRLGEDIQSKVLAFAFGLSAEIERNLISQRTKEALARRQQEGAQIGRVRGSQLHREQYKLYPYRQKISRWVQQGIGKREMARRLKTAPSTLRRFLYLSGIDENTLESALPRQGK